MENLKLPNNHPYTKGRACTTCEEFKPASEFKLERDKRAFGGVTMRSKCRTCDEFRKYKRSIERTYGFSWSDYEKMFDEQKGCCAICRSKISNARTSRLFVDHNHETDKVRGLLCHSCNLGLGLFKDSPKLLQNAIKYLSDRN